jgi:LptA/(LptD N-terminal domain) LPS transport protein
VFDGGKRQLLIQRGVQVDGPDDHLRCDEVAVLLTKQVDFGKRVDQSAIEVEQVECRGGVVMDHRSRDDEGITSHERMQLASLTVNQQTGAISGTGPGVIRSTHLANQLSGFTVPGAAPSPIPDSGAKLHFLRVDFQEGLKGNVIYREITFLTRVRTIYGPVDSWEQELDGYRPETLPPDTLILTSDKLRVNEDPLAANERAREFAAATGSPLGPVQMTAEGNVGIEGQSPKQGQFYATAERVSYTQTKEQLILEGSNRVPATLTHLEPGTGQRISNSAGKIIYNRLSGQAEWDTVRSFEFTPGSGFGASPKSALGPAAVRQ